MEKSLLTCHLYLKMVSRDPGLDEARILPELVQYRER